MENSYSLISVQWLRAISTKFPIIFCLLQGSQCVSSYILKIGGKERRKNILKFRNRSLTVGCLRLINLNSNINTPGLKQKETM